MVQRIAMSYGVDAALLALLAASGAVAWWVPAASLVGGWGICGATLWMYRSGWNRRFANPALTGPQAAAASALQVALSAAAPEVGVLTLSLLFLIFSIAALDLRLRPLVMLWLAASSGILGTMLFGAKPLSFPHEGPVQALLSGVWLALVLARCAMAGAQGGMLRNQLAQRNKELVAAKQRMDQLAEQLAGRNAELQALNASRTRLLAAACHDLRQPAHALGLLAEMAGCESDEAAREHKLEGIRRCSATLTDMLSMLMDMTQLEGRRYQPAVVDVPLGELMQELELQFAGLANRKGLMLLIPWTRMQVRSDRHLLRRILFNLVSNAVKYTQRGTVRVLVQANGGQVQLTVQDTGHGIPAERLGDVFVDYVRLDTDHRPEGLGIGLPIVKRAADLLGHGVHLRSRVGEGTAVTLGLPQAAAAASAPQLPPRVAPLLGQGRVVAVLEDDHESREALVSLLQHWGFQVLAAASRDDLLVQVDGLADGKPDLLIADLHVARGCGLQAAQALRERPGLHAMPALLITGDLDLKLVERAATLQICVTHKPVVPHRLRAKIAAVLQAGQGPRPD